MDEHITDEDYRKVKTIERREETNMSKRELVDKYINSGWEVVSRNPLTIQRGRMKKFFRNNILIDGG